MGCCVNAFDVVCSPAAVFLPQVGDESEGSCQHSLKGILEHSVFWNLAACFFESPSIQAIHQCLFLWRSAHCSYAGSAAANLYYTKLRHRCSSRDDASECATAAAVVHAGFPSQVLWRHAANVSSPSGLTV
jgi:hypothetical protein